VAAAWMLLWKRGTDSDPAALLIAVLAFTSLAILAGTQVVYLRDFLQGGDWYRMNTLFKFFMQVWALLGLAAAIAAPRLWRGMFHAGSGGERQSNVREPAEAGAVHAVRDCARSTLARSRLRRALAAGWAIVFLVLFIASLAFTVFGTPARLVQRMSGWRPEFGTLNGMEYMREGTYFWPDPSNTIELRYDWEAIRWLLDNVSGNPVIVETSEVDYYRAGGSRVASFTGISGLRGMHESEQRPGDLLSEREQLHREFWDSPDIERTREIIDQLGISLIYAGQLEQYLHPEGIRKLELMSAQGILFPVFENGGVTIYGVDGRLLQRADGTLAPASLPGGGTG
jgi:uncharacterized membrane protein